jgi:putative N6-adenine-specific DNA methylase
VLAAELSSFGLDARPIAGGAEAEGEDAAAMACLASRAADSVLLRVWEGAALELPAAKRAAKGRAGSAPLRVRVEGERATISLDAAGEPLFRRGWRARIGAAPLRESIAGAMLLASGWRGDRPFLDPMCGSGTIAIEAALAAARRAPGVARTFAFEAFPSHDARRTARLRARLRSAERPVEVPIQASDRNAGVLRLAARNAAAAGIAEAIRFTRADAAQLAPSGGPGLCATNPPWGVRLDEGAQEAWRALGVLVEKLAGWDVVVLGPDRGFERLLPVRPTSSVRLLDGGTACRLLAFHPARR